MKYEKLFSIHETQNYIFYILQITLKLGYNKLGYNELGYNEHPVITNKIWPKDNILAKILIKNLEN